VRITPPELPALVVGTVSHVRRAPLRHAFEHPHYQWLVDLDDLPRLPWPTSLVAGFDPRDHLDRGRLGGGIKADLSRWLASRGIALGSEDRVLMLAHARAFGHVFDPLTVFWCLRPNGDVRAIVLEVHNTYGERHAYLLQPDERGRTEIDKSFYVSPFNDTSGTYEVSVRLDPDRVRVAVALRWETRRILTAVTAGVTVPATARNVRRTATSHLFMTQRVSLLIRWHGIRLWLARLPVRPRPPHSEEAFR
jgi:uncharacterized protein